MTASGPVFPGSTKKETVPKQTRIHGIDLTMRVHHGTCPSMLSLPISSLAWPYTDNLIVFFIFIFILKNRRILAEYVPKSSAVLKKVGINEMWVPELLQNNCQ